jgi:serine/threonine protein kinase
VITLIAGSILSMQDTQVTDPLINKVLESRYRIEAEVGRGGMGVVYRGSDLTLSRPVAIKTILHRESDDNALDRFIKEARTLAQIENNRLVPVYAVGQDDGYHYLVMKFLEGETLSTRLKREGALAVDAVRDIVQQVCEGLSALHDLNLLHRDIKPANIMIGPDGQLTLMDLGIAKKIGEDTNNTASITMGTPRYMPPEVIDNQPLDPRADLYSLGVIAYQASTGKVPFDGPTPMSILYKQAHEQAKLVRELRPSLPKNLESAIDIALQKSANDRFQNAKEMAKAFSSHAQFTHSDSWKYSLLQSIILLVIGACVWLFIKSNYLSDQEVLTLKKSQSVEILNPSKSLVKNRSQSETQQTQLNQNKKKEKEIQRVINSSSNDSRPIENKTIKPKVPKKVVLPKSKTLRVKIYSSPTGAKVYVKNRLIGKTPFSLSKKDKKTVKYIAKLKGFRDQVFTISHQKVKRIRLKSVF